MPEVRSARAQLRESRTMLAAALANGPRELLDFILPLWAGAALGAGATEVGALVAAELAVSMLARPAAGVLADTRDRRRVAATGAFLYALSCLGYAVAPGLAVAYLAAVIGGLGGALLWVSVRAMAGERLADDSAVYPRLTAAEETGTWVAFVAGLSLLGATSFRALFLACAAACVAAGSVLLAAPGRTAAPAPEPTGTNLRRLRPMLIAVVITTAAETAVALLLLLHLQRRFDLEIVQIAYVFLPGAVAMGVLPEHLHRFVLRYGRTRVLAVASVSSAAFAAALAAAPDPWVVAVLWVLSGVAWAAVIPIQRAVIAEASGARVGRGMGRYEAAGLLGGLIGALAAGLLYDAGSWWVACAAASAVILSGAVLVPWSVRATGVADRPPGTVADRPPATVADRPPATVADRPPAAVADGPPATVVDRLPATPLLPVPTPAAPVRPSGASRPPDPPLEPAPGRRAARAGRSPYRRLAEHAALYLTVQVALLLTGRSWLRDLTTGDADLLTGERAGAPAGIGYGVGRVWTIVFVIDVVWTVVSANRTRR